MSLFRVTVQYLIATWEDERSQTETPPQCLGSRARFLDWKDTLADQCLLLHARAIRTQQARPLQSHPRVGGEGAGRWWPAKRSKPRECDCTPRRVGGGQKGSFRFDAIQDSTLEFFPSCCLSACRGRCDTTVHYSTKNNYK